MCNFILSFKDNAQNIIFKAKTAIEQGGGTFSGDSLKGSFKINSPSITGNYTITGQDLNIFITDKPFYVSCGKIEKKLKEYIDQP